MLYVLLFTGLVPDKLLCTPYCDNIWPKVPLVALLPEFGNFHPFGQTLPVAFAFTIVPPVPAVAAFHW